MREINCLESKHQPGAEQFAIIEVKDNRKKIHGAA